jgi:hypothetical protein
MASHAIYDKAPLELGGQSIRLVEILSSSKGPEISLRFHTTRLSRVPESIGSTKYYALSYTWGHTANQKRILVDGMEFYIRENLWHFLQQQTYLKSNDFIWIDALCIDQGNVHERNHQVMIMALIFSQVGLHFIAKIKILNNQFRQVMFSSGSVPRRTIAMKPWTFSATSH